MYDDEKSSCACHWVYRQLYIFSILWHQESWYIQNYLKNIMLVCAIIQIMSTSTTTTTTANTTTSSPQPRTLGRIKWFDNRKGFGFLTRLEDNVDIFLHFSSITVGDGVYKTLMEGEYVEFDVKQDDSGKNLAVDITGPRRGPLLCENTERRIYAVRRNPSTSEEGDTDAAPSRRPPRGSRRPKTRRQRGTTPSTNSSE